MTQSDLFNLGDLPLQSVELIELSDGDILWVKHFLPPEEANQLMATLQQQIPWRQDSIRIGGKDTPIPRLQAWFGDAGMTYTYSGLTLQPTPWLPALAAIKHRIEDYSDTHFNSLLANLYRTGLDSMGWHADDERELGPNPVIASVSLGQERRFDLRHRATGQTVRTLLPSGSVLVMAGATQHHWVHQVPRTTRPLQPRINLTFRLIRGR